MYLRVFKEDLINGILKATGIINIKSGAAYLRTLWLQAEDQKLTVMSTDGNIEFTGRYDANVLTQGMTGVEGKKFADLIRKLNPGEIILRVDDEGTVLIIEQNRKKYKLPTTDPSWFPDLDQFPDSNVILWSGVELKKIIDKTFFCISEDETMGALTCLKFDRSRFQENTVEVCAFDIQNISIYTTKHDDLYEALPEKGLLIPRKYIIELRKWLPADDIEICIFDEKFFIRTIGMMESINFPLNFDVFMDYHSIISSLRDTIDTKVLFDRNEMLQALDRIFIFSTDYNRAFVMEMSENTIILRSSAVEAGEANEEIECRFEGPVNKVNFNIKSMMDILSHFDSDEVKIEFSSINDPCRVIDDKNPEFYVITTRVMVKEETYYIEEEVR